MTFKPTLSVVIPCYQHARDCSKTVDRLLGLHMPNLELIVVIDGLKNDEKDAVFVRQMMQTNPNVKYLTYQNRLGKGGGIREGVQEAAGDFVAFIDADLVIHPGYLGGMLQFIEKDPELDAVIGKRVQYHTSFLRGFLSQCFRLGHRLLFIRLPWDTQAGVKIFPSTVAKEIFSNLQITGYAFDLDILLQIVLRKGKIGSYPIIQQMRGHSNVSIHTTLQMLRDTLSLYFWFALEEHRQIRDLNPMCLFLLLRHVVLLPLAFILWSLVRVLLRT